MYWSILGKANYIKLFHGLEYLAGIKLIVVTFNKYNGRIDGYKYSERLQNEFSFVESEVATSVTNKETYHNLNTLKFILPLNSLEQTFDSPKHAETITFKENIVIKANVEYTFAQWERHDNSLYLTLVPTKELYPKPKIKTLNSLPISLKEGVTDFLNEIDPNI